VGVRMPGDVDGGQHLPDRGGYVAHVATPVHLATGTRLPAVNTTRTNVGDLGGNGGTNRIAASG